MEIETMLAKLAAQARRAIQSTGVTTLEELALMRESEVRALHGIGRNALVIINATLAEHGLQLGMEAE